MQKTQENLLKAITGESLARNKYTFYAAEAVKEGLMWIAKVFEETADNERVHAKEELEKILRQEVVDYHNLTNLAQKIISLF
jgi:rubrerythrin